MAAAEVFIDVLGKLNPKYLLGVSATPERDDGTSFLMYNNIGRLLHKSTFEQMVEIGNVMRPFLRPIYLKKNKPYQVDSWQELVEKIKEDKQNLEVIASLIKKHYSLRDSQLCIIKQKSLINLYYWYLVKEKNIPPDAIAVMVGETTSKERKRILSEGKVGTIKIILASTVFDKAISLNELNILHNIFPSREINNTSQRVGRVSRTAEEKKYAIVYDYIYDHMITLTQYASSRKNCRMHSYEEVCVVPNYNEMLIKYIKNSFDNGFGKKSFIPPEFETEYKKLSVLEIDRVPINHKFDIKKYEPIITIGGDE